MNFAVVPIINGGHFRWGVKAPKKPYQEHPATIARFVYKQDAERFAEQCNAVKVAA